MEEQHAGQASPEVERAFRDHGDYVARVALRILGRVAEVEDVVQDTFVSALRDLHQLRDPAAQRAWLKTVTVRIARRRLVRARIRRFLPFGQLEEAQDDVAVARGATAEDRATLNVVYLVLDKMPVAERLAWTLRYVEKEQLEVVAALCGCSLATAKRRVAAAQKRIEEAFGGT